MRRFLPGFLPAGGVCVAAVLAVFAVNSVSAQVINGNAWPSPRLSVLTPTGGKIGASFEVGFAGIDLGTPEGLHFSHPGIKATPIIPPPPMPDPKADPKKPAPPPPPITKFQVTIDKAVPPGYYDVRFVGSLGVSNPRVFVVGDLNEIAEKEPNNDVEQATKVEIGSTVSGAIAAATDVDYIAFAGKKGQRLLITCLAASIDSRLNPELKLIGPAGKEVAAQRPLPQQDGFLDVTLPEDGDFLLRLNQFTYLQGGADYFYRLNISAGPWIDAVFPPVVELGKPATVTLIGRNLPGGKAEGKGLESLSVTITPPADPLAAQKLLFAGNISPIAAGLDGFEYRHPSPGGMSNPILLTYAMAPVVLEKEGNDTADKAQDIATPCELCGRVDRTRDRDWYVFSAKKGDVLMFEMFSERLGAPTDMYFVIRNMETKTDFPMQDDMTDLVNNKNFYNFTRDPAPFRFVAPADGKYHVLVASQVGDILAGPDHVYRLRIAPERPDYRLIVMPSEDFRPDAASLLKGGEAHYTVFALRRDGFKEDITLTLEGLPSGVTCPPQVLNGKMKFAHLVMSTDAGAPPATAEIKVRGAAVFKGEKLVREARPATVTWPVQANQNIPTITRLDRALVLSVRDKAPGRLVSTMTTARVSLGDKLKVPLKLVRGLEDFKANFQIAPVPGDLPANVNFANLTFAPGKDEQVLDLAVNTTALPGTYNIVFRGFAPITPGGAKAKPVNTIIVSNPIQLVILPKQVANLTVDNPNPMVKLGKDAATGVVMVKVARQFDYADSFKVELVLPKEVNDVAADPTVIPAGENEIKLTLRIPPSAAAGTRSNLTIRATAVIHGDVVLVHETKINVNIVK